MNSLFTRRYLPFTLIIISFFFGVVNGTINVVGRTPALSFEDEQDLFGPKIGKVQGLLHVARPLDACTPLQNLLLNISSSNFALIKMGGCSLQQKVRTAQVTGFNVAVVYKEYSDRLLIMEGHNEYIKIPTIFISRESGETLLEISGYTGVDVKITANDENVDYYRRIQPVLVIIGVFLVYFALLRLIRNESPTYVRHPLRMSTRLVKALPCVVYDPPVEPNSTNTTCVICMEDFTSDAMLPVLPCNHRYHRICIDTWLTKWRAFCPICKHDAREKMQNPPASVSSPINCISITNKGSSSHALQRGPSTNYGSFDPPLGW